MSPYLMHTDTSVYSKPFEFMPERWLDENFNPNMMRNFVPFARGMSLIYSMSQSRVTNGFL